jgi:DNA-directed RNA polymerase subunit RPC12/RpoP
MEISLKEEVIKELLNSSHKLISKRLLSPKWQYLIDKINKTIQIDIPLRQKIFLVLEDKIAVPLCSCGKPATWIRKIKGFSNYCSSACAGSDPKVISKRKNTVLEKYGVDSISQLPEIKQIKEDKSLLAYGTKSPAQSQIVKDRVKANNNIKFGVDYPNQLPEIREKNSKAIKLLRKDPIKERERLDRVTKSYLESLLEGRFKGLLLPLFTIEEYEGNKRAKPYPFKCMICSTEFEGKFYNGRIPACPTCNPYSMSKGEQEIASYLKDTYEVIQNTRSLIGPYEVDIYIPEKRLAIEYNGVYWHSKNGGAPKPDNYHQIKYILCKNVGVTLLQFFDDEWHNKKEICLSIINSKLGIFNKVIGARKCSLKRVSPSTQREFLELNHIQGYSPSSIAYGLFYDKELIALGCFSKSRYNKKYIYELLRFATKIGFRVQGGLSKIIAEFQNNYSTSNLISYCDKRLFTGKSYESVGFKKIDESEPNYYYMHTSNYKIRYSRIKFQKHKLKNLLEVYDSKLSEWENMKINGYDKIYDAGMFVFGLSAKEEKSTTPLNNFK